jgi:RNA polymerase sigma factor (sigma-70 family)
MRVETEEQTDDQLLQQYVQTRNQKAFAELVQRYGPMVWGVCRRIVRHTQDAEDALQATFAVLARKAQSIRGQRTIGGWLHQVARRIALNAKASSNRRNAVMPVSSNTDAVEQAAGKGSGKHVDHKEVLDDEIARLPTLLRLPIILCYLEGLTNREAAERLGCPEGTIVSRLARAREKLRLGLTKRGVILGAAALTVLLTEIASAAEIPPKLLQKAFACGMLPPKGPISNESILTRGAARLANGALRSMVFERLAVYAAIMTVVVLGASAVVYVGSGLTLAAYIAYFAGGVLGILAGLLVNQRLGPGFGEGRIVDVIAPMVCGVVGVIAAVWLVPEHLDSPAARFDRNNPLPVQPAPVAVTETDVAIPPLEGIWEGEDLEFVGGANATEHAALSRECRWVIFGNSIQFKWKDVVVFTAAYQVDPNSEPKAIDFQPSSQAASLGSVSSFGAFRQEKLSLEVCTAEPSGERPDSIRTGMVPRPAEETHAIRTGAVGYAKLKRVQRSFENEELQGKWILTHMELDGRNFEMDENDRQGALFDSGAYVMYHAVGDSVGEVRGTFMLVATQPNHYLEINPGSAESHFSCRYDINGDTLRLAASAPGAARPDTYKSLPGQKRMVWIFKRAKPAEPTPP